VIDERDPTNGAETPAPEPEPAAEEPAAEEPAAEGEAPAEPVETPAAE